MSEPDSEIAGRIPPGQRSDPFPGPFAATGLALTGLFLSSLIASLLASAGLAGRSPLMASMGIGYALGLGGIATLAAQRVPPPHDQRMGLRAFDLKLLPAMAALLPTLILLSEFNVYLEWVLPPSPEFLELREQMKSLLQIDSTFSAIQTLIVAVGIIPIIEGFFFFGVLQQGVTAKMGRLRGAMLTTVLYSVVHFPASGAPGDSLVPLPSWLIIGGLLCLVRLASGSILPVIGLTSAFSLIHIAAGGPDPLFSIPAFNMPGQGIPGLIFWPSLVVVALGVSSLWKTAQQAPAEIPLPPKDEAGPAGPL